MTLVAEKEEAKEFRYGVPDDIYSEWRAAQRRIGLPQNQILHRLVRFLLEQDQVTQGMILKTLEPRPDLIEFVLRNIARQKTQKRPGVYGALAAKKGNPTQGGE
jgi:hypothetical protein